MRGPSTILIHRIIARLNIGGPAMHVVNLTRALNEEPFRTRLIAGSVPPNEGDMTYYAQERGVEVTTIPDMSRELSLLGDLRTLWRLYRLLRAERPRIVHTHTAKAGTVGRLAAAMARVPVIIHTYHGHVLGGGYFSPWWTRIFLEIERQMARLTSRLVVLTARQAREMAENLRVAPIEKFVVIPLGLELDHFVMVHREAARDRMRDQLGIDPEESVIGIVGRLTPVKNHELLFDSVAELDRGSQVNEVGEDAMAGILRSGTQSSVEGRRYRIVVVGSGEREESLRRYAERRGIGDRVLWLGWRKDMPDLYAAMDVLALTSLDEGTPVAVIEALAAGTPVVARAVGGVPEVLEGGRWGRLVPSDDPRSFATALHETIVSARSPEAVEEGRLAVARRYSVKRLAGDMALLYQRERARGGQ